MKKRAEIKVCHFSSAHSSEDERVFHEEAVSLSNNGFQVFYVVKGRSYKKNGVNIIGVNDESHNRIGRIISFSRKIYRKALEIDADLYHFHDPELLPYGVKLAKRGKIVIFDSHENTVDQINEKEWIPSFIRGILSFAFDKYQRYACKKFDCIISVSPHICDYFRKFHGNVRMITNFPPFREVDISNKDETVICYAGNLSDQWNHRKIIKAISKIEGAKYLLMGRGTQSYIEELKALPGWDKVDFRGEVPHEEVPDLIAKASIGMAVLSYNKNVGGKKGTLGNTKIYEEMMSGLPIICTDFDIWRSMVEKYDCGICVNPNDDVEIEKAIRYLITHPGIARTKGANGLRAVKEEYNWTSQEIKLLQIYDELLQII